MIEHWKEELWRAVESAVERGARLDAILAEVREHYVDAHYENLSRAKSEAEAARPKHPWES